MRAAHLLNGFAWNWEIAERKDKGADRALGFLVVALVGIVGLAVTVLLAVV
jgi:hypothetical protein